MQIIADLQIHSRFSRAVSKQMTLPNIALWGAKKGIGLIATGDWTHPMWFREIERDLEEVGNGLLKLKSSVKTVALGGNENFYPSSNPSTISPSASPLRGHEAGKNFVGLGQPEPYFLLATEVSSIYTQNGKGRRVHTLIWVPSIDSARKISQEMTRRGCNLLSDGRPIIALSTIHVAELVLSIEPKALVFPAHAWTPWFSTYGSMSGFTSIEEAYGEYAKYVYAVETGLSSDPSMNWQIKELDNRTIVSFSDAHSGPKIGREATVFEIPEGKLSYDAIYSAIRGDQGLENTNNELRITNNDQKENSKIVYTIEFHPEEGKYHYTGHRACNIRYGPDETRKKGTTCPVCGKPLTQGVTQRVEELAGRTQEDLKLIINHKSLTQNGPKVAFTASQTFPNRPPYVMLVPLLEIVAEAIGSSVISKKSQAVYERLINEFGNEFNVLLNTTKEQISAIGLDRVAEGVEKVRSGDIVVDPGYDGVFGVVKIWSDGETKLVDKSKEQLGLF